MKKLVVRRGFTLAELLIVVVVIGLLAIIVIMNYQRQIARANDTKRKTDLEKLKTAFEDYYNDHFCYPDQTIINTRANCDGPLLSPYIDKMPCDPITKDPYLYMPLDETSGSTCSGYRLLTTLEDWGDIAIINAGCSKNPKLGCGFIPPTYNYGISMGGSITLPGFDPNTVPSEAIATSPSVSKPIACDENGVCNGVDSTTFTCGAWFERGKCTYQYCQAHPDIWCRRK